MNLNTTADKTNQKNLSCLESNFREIYHATTCPSNIPLPLVANLSATRIYDSRYGWGRLWRLFYQAIGWITKNNFHLEKLRKTILKTEAIFSTELHKAEKSLKKYQEYLEKTGKGYSVTEYNYFSARRHISAWNTATKPFLKLLHNTPLINHRFKDLKIEFSPDVFSSQHIPLFHTCQKIINLEGMMGGPLPLSILRKIIRTKPLNSLDQKDLVKWIGKINKEKLEVSSVHQALKALSSLYKKHKEGISEQTIVANLAVFLEDNGCKILQKGEEKHLIWRQHLSEGTTISLNTSTITLGSEIYPQYSDNDQTRAYNIQGEPNLIALIAQNTLALAMRDLRMRKQPSFGVESAVLTNISPDGKIAVTERLKPLSSVHWASTENQISRQDEPLIDALTQTIQKFIKENITPSTFSPTYLMFNEQLQLKFVKPSTPKPFDFNAIEDFIVSCSAGNLTIYKELMIKSGLITHPTAKFYSDLLSNTFLEEKEEIEDLAGIYKISDPKVIDRGLIFIEQIQSIKKQLHPRLRQLFPKDTPGQLKTKAKNILTKLYSQYKLAGLLWPTFTEDVLLLAASKASR